MPVQYVRWMRELAANGWGFSPTWRQPVLQGIRQRLPATLELVLYAMVPAVLLALVLGSTAARRHRRLPDHVIRAASFVAWAFPPFILALLLLDVFYAKLGWLPPERLGLSASLLVGSGDFQTYTGLVTVDAILNREPRVFFDALRHLVLPALTLALIEWALLTRIMRSSLLGVLRKDYVTVARAKGLTESAVVGRHARRNAVLPVISAGGTATSILISGIVVVEAIFSYNGVGSWAVRGILNSDVPVAAGFALLSCMVSVHRQPAGRPDLRPGRPPGPPLLGAAPAIERMNAMDRPSSEALEQAIELARAGETERAHQIVAAHLVREPGDVRAWLFLGLTLDDPEQQIYALRRVLEIDPGNRPARAALRRRTGTATPSPGSLDPVPLPRPRRRAHLPRLSRARRRVFPLARRRAWSWSRSWPSSPWPRPSSPRRPKANRPASFPATACRPSRRPPARRILWGSCPNSTTCSMAWYGAPGAPLPPACW